MDDWRSSAARHDDTSAGGVSDERKSDNNKNPVPERFGGKWDNVKTALWFIAMLEVLILFLALIVGHCWADKNALFGFAILGMIIGMLLMSIVLIAVVGDGMLRWLSRKLRK